MSPLFKIPLLAISSILIPRMLLKQKSRTKLSFNNNEFKFIEESDAEYFDKFQDNYYNKIEDSNTNITDSYEDSFYDDIRRTE